MLDLKGGADTIVSESLNRLAKASTESSDQSLCVLDVAGNYRQFREVPG
jgi:hypothetical protein